MDEFVEDNGFVDGFCGWVLWRLITGEGFVVGLVASDEEDDREMDGFVAVKVGL